MQYKRKQREERMREDLQIYGDRILRSDEMRQAFGQKHHKLSTVGDHTMRVARASLCICYALRRLNVPTDIPSVVAASLCHDLGILGRAEKYKDNKECGRQHPVDSVETARRLMGELSEKTADTISRHMWPFAGSKPPNSLEAVIVSTADKIATVEDYVAAIRKKAKKKL